jgi:hypothetical protein
MIEIVAHLVAYAERHCPAYVHDNWAYVVLAVAIWTPWFLQAALLGLAYFRREVLFWLVGLWSTAAAVMAAGLVALIGVDDRPLGGCGTGPAFPSDAAQYMGLVSGTALAYWVGWRCTPPLTTAGALLVANAAFAMARLQLRYDSHVSLAAGYVLGAAQAVFWMSLLWRYRHAAEWLRKSWLGSTLCLYDTLCIAHGSVVEGADPAAYASPPAASLVSGSLRAPFAFG